MSVVPTPSADFSSNSPPAAFTTSDSIRTRPSMGSGAKRRESSAPPTVVFTVAGHNSRDVAAHLASRRIAVWSGDNYACELVDAFGLRSVGGVVRAGVVRYTTADDVAALLAALRELGA